MSLRELRALVDEVAVVDWRDPAWWAVIGGTALIEALTRRAARAAYLSSDGQPDFDTFMGWPAPSSRGLAGAIADAIADAAAASRAIAELDGSLPGQPLAVTVRAGDRASTVEPVDPGWVRFAIAGQVIAARVSDRPDALSELARTLARTAGSGAGHAPDVRPTAIAAVIGDHDAAVARHLHRRTWGAGGGPWLGLGRAGGLAVASTCHLVVDGFGHALIAGRIAAARERDGALRAALRRAAAEIAGDAPVPALPALAAAQPLGIAWRALPPPLPRFPALAHALGCELHDEAGDPSAPMSPVIQVPVAPGRRDDPDRWRRRVVHTLLSVRFDRGRAEPVDRFARRVSATIAREVDGRGLLSRLVAAAAAVPLPLAIKRRRLVGARGARLRGPVEVLAGRSSLSLLRGVPAGLVAVSAPGRVLDPGDPRSTSVITIVEGDRGGAIVTVSGSGLAGTAAGAEALLDRWLARALLDRAA